LHGSVDAHTTVQHVTCNDKLDSEDVKIQFERFDEQVEQRLSNENFVMEDRNVARFYIEDEVTEHLHGLNHPCKDADYSDTITEDYPEENDIKDKPMHMYVNGEAYF
jgi:hypothetical protein